MYTCQFKLYQFSHVERLRLRNRWTSLGFKSLRNYLSVLVMHFQNGRNICSADDRCSGIARLAIRSSNRTLNQEKGSALVPYSSLTYNLNEFLLKVS